VTAAHDGFHGGRGQTRRRFWYIFPRPAGRGSWTDAVVRVTVPRGLPPGTVDVQVVAPDGRTATLPAAFEITGQAAPALR
jgi:hypothetical protein